MFAVLRSQNNLLLRSGFWLVHCDQGKIKKEMRTKQYWKDKWESCTIHFVKSFSSTAFQNAREKEAAERQKTSGNFTAVFCFLQAFSPAKAWQKSQQTENEAAVLSCLGLFFSLSSWLTYSALHFPNCHLPSSNCFQIPWGSCEGETLSHVPIFFCWTFLFRSIEFLLIPSKLM